MPAIQHAEAVATLLPGAEAAYAATVDACAKPASGATKIAPAM
jgi:hypothetical protein